MPKLTFFIRAFVCLGFVFLPLQSMDQWFYDHFFRLRGVIKRGAPIVLVTVNDARIPEWLLTPSLSPPKEDSLSRLRSSATWHSRLYDKLLEIIVTDGPKLVAFTSYYDWVDTRTPVKADPRSILFSAFLNEDNKLVPPPASLTTSDNYGFANIFPDPDNVVRKTFLVYSSGSSLARCVHNRLSTRPATHHLLEPIWIDFRGPAGTYPSVEASTLLEEEYQRGYFKGKIVLIGREDSPARYFETPFGRMPRMEIHANSIDTFLGDREIRILPSIVTRITAVIAVLVSITIIMYFPLSLAWLFLLLFSLILALSALFALAQLKMWPGIANPIFCIFGTHILMVGYKLNRQEEHQWKIQQEAEYLKEMDQFKNNFISLFSHDLKTPIAKIKAILDRVMTETPDLTEPVKEGLKSIDRANSELARLISDILKVTKMESMAVEPNRDVIDLNRIAEMAVQRLKFHSDEKNLEMILDLEPLFSMEGDHQLIQEVLINLVENAIKYSPAGSKVVVRTTEEGDRVRVSVRDEGIGIPADELPRVTGKFYRGRLATDTTKGSGLGLYLSKYFIELHRGELEIRSEMGKGTEVSFWLPLTA